MRNIKFRIYIKELDTTFNVNTITFLEEGIRVFIKGNDTKNYLIDGENNVLLQSTDEKDINGNELYEGDIIKTSSFDWQGASIYIIKNGKENIPDNEDWGSNNINGFYFEEIPISYCHHIDSIRNSIKVGNIYLNPNYNESDNNL